MPHWDAVGPDFVARMSHAPEPETESNVVPLRRGLALPEADGTGWDGAARRLQAQDQALYSAWFAPLQVLEVENGILTLLAPSRFIASYVRTHYLTRLLAAITAENREVREVQIVCEGAG